MLIAHLIGGAILFASFSLRMPHVSSTLSLFFTAFKSMAPISLVRQNEGVFSTPPLFIGSPSPCADVAPFPSPAVTNLAVCHPHSQYPDLGFTTGANGSTVPAALGVGFEGYFSPLIRDEEKLVSNPALRPNILLLLASLCAILLLYCVSYPRTTHRPSSEGYFRQVFAFEPLAGVSEPAPLPTR